MTISVIIVNYNVKEFLQQCILSLKKSLKNQDAEIIVVDNASVDGSSEMIRCRFPEIRFIQNNVNRGFATACNQGLEISKGDLLLILNPDTMVQEDTIQKMIEFFKSHPESGAAGCKILNADGTLQLACRRSFPTPSIALPKLLGLSKIFPKSPIFGKYNLTYLDPNKLTEVDAISGSFMMFRRTTWRQVGNLDEQFFMYGEDLDFCYRIEKAGWKIYYVPYTKIIHYKGESVKSSSFNNFVAFYKAMDIFVKKHFSKSYSLLFDFFVKIGILFRGTLSIVVRTIQKHIVFIVDGVVLSFAIIIAHNLQSEPLPPFPVLIYMLSFYLVLWLGIGYVIGLYDRKELSYSRAIVASVISFVISVILNFIFKGVTYSPQLIIWSFISVSILLPGWRIFMLLLQRKRIISPRSPISKALLSRRTILVGADEEGKRIAKKLQTHIEHGFEILGFVDKKFIPERIDGFPFLGVVSDLPEIIRINKASELIFTTDRFNNNDILNIMDAIKGVRVNLKIVPKHLDFILGKSSVEKIEDIPLVAVDYNLLRISNRICKRLLDFTISSLVSIVASPFIISYAYLSGSRLVRIKYWGQNSSIFTSFTIEKRDGRKIYKFIKQFPLIWSVVKGDMSLVGCELIPANPEVHHLGCKPGLTGLFQLQMNKNPGNIDRRNYEHYYMQNHSIFLDIEILLKEILKA